MFEKVNPSHPDKLGDRIAGAIVDLAYKNERSPKIAVEVLLDHGKCHIIVETSTHLNPLDVKAIVLRIAGKIIEIINTAAQAANISYRIRLIPL